MDFLTQPEITKLTGRKRRDSQVEALRKMGIQHKIRPDGSPVVLSSHIQKLLDGGKEKIMKAVEPNWSAI